MLRPALVCVCALAQGCAVFGSVPGTASGAAEGEEIEQEEGSEHGVSRGGSGRSLAQASSLHDPRVACKESEPRCAATDPATLGAPVFEALIAAVSGPGWAFMYVLTAVLALGLAVAVERLVVLWGRMRIDEASVLAALHGGDLDAASASSAPIRSRASSVPVRQRRRARKRGTR